MALTTPKAPRCWRLRCQQTCIFVQCKACKRAQYCSDDCMYEDNRFNWHRVYCEHVTSAGASTEELNDCEFYNTIAVRDLGVEYLLGSMGLRSPRVDPSGRGILKPMRRLVITGNDTQENFAMLFGQHNVHGLLLWLHQQVRREVLIKPPPNSPMNAKVVELNLDENCPEWTPREMNIEEREEIMNINMMILGIHRYVQVQGVGVATVDEAYGFIASWYEGDWPKSRHLFDYAVKAMKCGQLAE